MSYYNLNAIADEDLLENSRQYRLTKTTNFKILETGVHAYTEDFVVRVIRNYIYPNGNPYVLYVDMSKYDFDQITREAGLISYLLQNQMNKTVFQSPNVHVWTQAPPKNEPAPAMLCIRGSDGTRIYIIESTFNRLFNCVNSVERAYGRFTGDLDDDSSSYSDSENTEEYTDDDYYDDHSYDDHYYDDDYYDGDYYDDDYYDDDYYDDDYDDDDYYDDDYNNYYY